MANLGQCQVWLCSSFLEKLGVFSDEEGFLQSSKEGLLTEAEVSELPRRPAVPLTCWEEMDVSTAKKEVGDLLVA